MSNELMKVEFESLSGITVTLDAATVRNTLTRGNGKVSDQEVAMFIRTCQAKQLDPFENGEVYLIKYDDRSPASLVVGYHAYVRRADHFPDYRGFKAGVTVLRDTGNGPVVVQKEGCCLYKALKETLIGGWCRVFHERSNGVVEETYTEVSLDEYSTGKSNWSAKPATMIRKVAVSQAFRAAFPNAYEGLYTTEEMQVAGAIPANVIDMNRVTSVHDEDPVATKAQWQSVFKLAREHLGEAANDVIKALLGEQGRDCTDGTPITVFNKINSRLLEIIDEKKTTMNTSDKEVAPDAEDCK